MELHCSQTAYRLLLTRFLFETPMELHCSQTTARTRPDGCRLRPLWNYTALKHEREREKALKCLRPLWNYTALKPLEADGLRPHSLRPLWNYTALKRY